MKVEQLPIKGHRTPSLLVFLKKAYVPLTKTKMASISKESFGMSTRLSGVPRVTGETDEGEIDPNVCC